MRLKAGQKNGAQTKKYVDKSTDGLHTLLLHIVSKRRLRLFDQRLPSYSSTRQPFFVSRLEFEPRKRYARCAYETAQELVSLRC